MVGISDIVRVKRSCTFRAPLHPGDLSSCSATNRNLYVVTLVNFARPRELAIGGTLIGLEVDTFYCCSSTFAAFISTRVLNI